MVLEIDDVLWTIAYFQHVKPGKGGALAPVELRTCGTGPN